MLLDLVEEDKATRIVRYGFAIQRGENKSAVDTVRIVDLDPIERGSMPIGDFEAVPMPRDARIDEKGLTAQVDSQYALERRAIHPRR